MSFLYFIRLIIKNIIWLLAIPSVVAMSIYFFTRHEVKVYSSETVIYTGIASGYSLSGSNRADFYATSNAFDNLISLINSRETREQVGIQLLASHLSLPKHDPSILSWSAYDDLKKQIPDSVRKKVVKSSIEETIEAITSYMQEDENNVIYRILNSANPYYSINALKNAKASRVSNSDLIRISYETNDAAICQHTLELLQKTFIKKHRILRDGQTESVVSYFEAETRKAYAKLDSMEKAFLEFNKRNDIINYYEQTKAVAGEREDLYALTHSLEMDKLASGESLFKVNESLKGKAYQILYGSKILQERERLSDVYGKIALSEIIDNKNGSQQRQIDSMKRLSSDIENNIRTTLDNLYIQNNTPNGIPTKTVLDEWLKSTLEFEQSKARLATMDKRKKEFSEEYKRYAPLGAMLKKLERQISVCEQEYLELLHGLNMAKLTQQNNELTSKLTIVDAPFFPVKANASKRILQTVLGFLITFILILSFILAKALINKTLQEPARASKIIGLPLFGIYPTLKQKSGIVSKANLRLTQQLLASIDHKKRPINIGVISCEHKEGKSTIIDIWEKELTTNDYSVNKLLWGQSLSPDDNLKKDINIYEFTALEYAIINAEKAPEFQQVFLISRANRVWGKKDTESINMFTKIFSIQPKLILNGVDISFVEEYIGEAPKKRNHIRAFIKHLAKFEFGNRKSLLI